MSKCLNLKDPLIESLLKIIKSEPSLSKVLDTFGDKPYTKAEVLAKYKEMNAENPYPKQVKFFEVKLKSMENRLKKFSNNSPEHTKLSIEIDELKKEFEETRDSKSREGFKNLGESVLKSVDEFITELENGTARDTAANIEHSKDIIDAWVDFTDTATTAMKLRERLVPFWDDFKVEQVNKYNTQKNPDGSKKEISLEDINSQNEDIGTFKRGTGALSDLKNYIASTIGAIINGAQNRSETKTKKLYNLIKDEVDVLNEYAKSTNTNLDSIYKLMVQESKSGTLVLAREYNKEGLPNDNYEKIQNTPELKRFYDFYKKTIAESTSDLPISFGEHFIPNIPKESLKDKVKSLWPVKTVTVGKTVENEDIADVAPLKYHKPIPAAEKSDNLGAVLFEFAKFAENHKEMSKILPTVRVLQESLKSKVLINGEVKERRFIKPGIVGKDFAPEETNLYKMIDTVVDMQVKDKMKIEQGKVVLNDFYDENGDKKQTILDVTKTIDTALKYNSLLRIGFSPLGAFVNWLFGDISNLLEGIGGQFFTVGGLKDASNIFFKQNFTEDSTLNKLLVELNPLQELDDYEYIESIKSGGEVKKMSAEKLYEYMYSLQKAGEKFLQSRTMLAVMIKDGYLNSDGSETSKYTKATEEEKQQLSDKIKRLNQKIHGRYTSKEAATLSQNVVFRAVSQFRKWIPAAIENRLGEKQWDRRLQAEIEGTYVTFNRLVLKNWSKPGDAFSNLIMPLIAAKKLLESGKMTESEIYNMRKMVSEIIMIASLTMLYAMLHGGDDDEDKKRRKNPYIKTALTILDRASGDLEFFYSPTQATNLMKNAVPMAKMLKDVIDATTVIPKVLYTGKYENKQKQNKVVKEFSEITPLVTQGYSIYSKLLGKSTYQENK